MTTTTHHSHEALELRERAQDEALALPGSGRCWIPSPEQQVIIHDIVSYCGREGVQPEELAAATMNAKTKKARHPSSWIKIMRGNLEAGDRTALFNNFIQAFKLVYRRRELEKKGVTAFVPTEAFKLLKTLIANAEAKQGIGSAERLVIAVGDTGKGKTTACDQVIAEHGNGVTIHGNPVWKCSYKAVLWDVCVKAGVATVHDKGREKTTPELSRDLLAELKTNRRTLYFEELDRECLTASLVKLWMTLLNQTLATVVLAINPDALDAIRRLGLTGDALRKEPERPADIAAQLLRRCRQASFSEVEAVVPQELLKRTLGPVAGLDEATAALARAGALGGYSLVVDVIKTLALTNPTGVPAAAVADAVRVYHSRFKAGSESRVALALTDRPGTSRRGRAA